MPLAVYYFVLKGGYGYQARYGMAALCVIPLMATIGNSKNLVIPRNQIQVVLYFVPIAFISDWFISGFRYSHGLPFQVLSWGSKSFSIWLNNGQLFILLICFVYYLFITFKLIRKLTFSEQNNSDLMRSESVNS